MQEHVAQLLEGTGKLGSRSRSAVCDSRATAEDVAASSVISSRNEMHTSNDMIR